MLRIFLTSFFLAPLAAFGFDQAPDNERDWTSIEIVLSFSLLVFALVLIGIEAYIIKNAQKPWLPMNIVRLIGLTLILCLAAFLVIAGYGKEQISAVIGLLGVIAGYLLGANGGNNNNGGT